MDGIRTIKQCIRPNGLGKNGVGVQIWISIKDYKIELLSCISGNRTHHNFSFKLNLSSKLYKTLS